MKIKHLLIALLICCSIGATTITLTGCAAHVGPHGAGVWVG